jgi:glutamate/aspartate transport system substrate-binding protein
MSSCLSLVRTAWPILLAIGLGPALLPAHAGPVLDRIRSTGTVVLAHRESSVPFSFVGADGKPVGYAVDLCLKLVDAVGKALSLPQVGTKFVQVTPSNRIAMIENNTADLECGSTTNNAERREKVAFTVPHYITGARYLVRADSPIDVLRDFSGRKLVSTQATTPLKAVTRANSEYMLGITLLEAPDHTRAVDMVASGEADGFVMDDVLLYGLAAGRPDPKAFKVVGKFLTIEPLAIMLPRNDPDFKRLVDAEMKRLIRTQEAHAIYERWFQSPIPPSNRSLNLPMNYLLKDFWKYPTDQVPG